MTASYICIRARTFISVLTLVQNIFSATSFSVDRFGPSDNIFPSKMDLNVSQFVR